MPPKKIENERQGSTYQGGRKEVTLILERWESKVWIIRNLNSLKPWRKCGLLIYIWLRFAQIQDTKRCSGSVCFENNSYPRKGTREPIRFELRALRSKVVEE